jgi:hypothetical protein
VELEDWYEQLRDTHPEMLPAQRRPRTARGHWHPTLARVYGIKPWEMGQLTLSEMRAIADDVEALNAA